MDNSTTSYTDNTADVDLGAQVSLLTTSLHHTSGMVYGAYKGSGNKNPSWQFIEQGVVLPSGASFYLDDFKSKSLWVGPGGILLANTLGTLNNCVKWGDGVGTAFLDAGSPCVLSEDDALFNTVQVIPTTVGSLGTCNGGLEGTIRAVTNALAPTFLVAVVAGGTVHTPVYCDGTNWVAF